MHLKMLSAEVVCCKYLPSITDELSIEANSVDPEQTAGSLIWVHTVCYRGFLNISADEKSRRLFLFLFLNKILYTVSKVKHHLYIFAEIIFKLAFRNFLDMEDPYLL